VPSCRWLDGTCDKTFENSKGTAAVATKTAADQLIWAPIMTCAFFAFLKVLEGHPELAIPTCQAKVLQTVAANYVIWPAAHVVSFKYVPSHQRILYNNVIAIFWNCYLSIVAADQGMDPSMLGGIDGQTAVDLMGLRDISRGLQSTLPLESSWLADLLQFGSPSTQQAVAALERSGISSPFIERVIAIQSAVLR
jgi:Mpv17 / PMP22 family